MQYENESCCDDENAKNNDRKLNLNKERDNLQQFFQMEVKTYRK